MDQNAWPMLPIFDVSLYEMVSIGFSYPYKRCLRLKPDDRHLERYVESHRNQRLCGGGAAFKAALAMDQKESVPILPMSPQI